MILLNRIFGIVAILTDTEFNPGLLRIPQEILNLVWFYGGAHESRQLHSYAQQQFS